MTTCPEFSPCQDRALKPGFEAMTIPKFLSLLLSSVYPCNPEYSLHGVIPASPHPDPFQLMYLAHLSPGPSLRKMTVTPLGHV